MARVCLGFWFWGLESLEYTSYVGFMVWVYRVRGFMLLLGVLCNLRK